MSSFSGLSTALSALQATRKAMDVTGNNIANVATPGYTRQRVDLQAATTAVGLMTTGQQGGNGVVLTGVSRLASSFWDAQVRSQTSLHADLASRADVLNNLQDLTGEPSDTALSGKLSAMWSAFANLAANPTKDSAKSVVISAAQDVAQTLKNSSAGVVSMWNDQRTQATSLANEVNATTQAVATYNKQIKATVAAGNSANELMDQRDQLVTRLSELTGATTVQAANGVVDVYLGSNALVQDGSFNTVQVSAPTTTNTLPPTASPTLQFADGTPASVRGGQLAGVLDALRVGGTLDTASAKYDAVAAAVSTSVNAAYAAAFNPSATPADPVQPFFTGSTASGVTGLTVAVSLAGAPTTPGTTALRTGNSTLGSADASVALAMSKLGKATGSPDNVWATYVSQLGADAAGATSRTTATAATLSNTVASQQSETGVSLDEETANLLTLQRAYQAAARVLTSVDEALDTLINKTGLVGR
ncbi:flagellar hook-associated protein FlgK [Quadrisphaera setariae]|uniref:Flagellar hook-associated protein 1 n=1 Tax=Quadrisphaera setariae TaxID=2593304 RepID=A0A5C8ZDR2_9ACTN|nr:flagellar hook-associated protein FlgK [Quadrisphaera setariae]TXR55056.1 flagellar hook-associated protein FlgK [Quadrisphaera setariae]